MIQDWEFLKHGNVTYLIHTRCPSGIADDCPACARKILRNWVCCYCGEMVPEEIEFVADLDGHVYKYDEDVPEMDSDYTPDLYDHNGEWLNSNCDIPVPVTAPLIATPEQYLYEKIALEQADKDLKDWDKQCIRLWKNFKEEFTVTTPVYPIPSNCYTTNLARTLAKVK